MFGCVPLFPTWEDWYGKLFTSVTPAPVQRKREGGGRRLTREALRAILGLAIMGVLILGLAPQRTSALPVHNLNTAENYSSIQEAIDALNTSAGHVIEVDSGTFIENIVVNKMLTIKSSTGDPYSTVIQAANTSNNVVTVTADYVTLSGFLIRGSTDREQAGINLTSSGNRIINNILMNNYHGIVAYNSSFNTLTDNSATYNNMVGIYLRQSSSNNQIFNNELSNNGYGLRTSTSGGNSSNNQIIQNTIVGNRVAGMWLNGIQHTNTISNNTVTNNTYFGIGVSTSSNLLISSNVAKFNENGIGLLGSNNITVTNNIADENKLSGIYLDLSDNNTFTNNSVSSNTFEGFFIIESSHNTVSCNTIAASYFGAFLYSSTNNIIADNNAETCYYGEVGLYFSPDNIIINDTWFIQEDIVYGTSLSISESTPSAQAVDNETRATYSLVLKNLGNMPDTFELVASSSDDPEVLILDTTYCEDVFPRARRDITLSVSDTDPGIYRATVEARSLNDVTVKDSVETRTLVRGIVGPEPDNVTNSITDSAIINCTEEGSTRSSIQDSRIEMSAIVNSTVSDSTITNSVILNSVVVGTTLSEVTLDNATVRNGVISVGIITINGISYSIDRDQRVDLLVKSDYRDSDLVGLMGARTLYVAAAESEVDFDISAQGDYFAGSLSVQRATIPPTGVRELTNSIGGYIWANVSENVANSTGWVLIKVYYDPAELGAIDESSLTLRYYNESKASSGDPWEDVPVSGRDLDEHYVWGNLSHYSVFSVSGAVTPKRGGGSGGKGTHADWDNDGLTDIQELLVGTDPRNPDTDGDGFLDGVDPYPLDPHLPLRLTPTEASSYTPAPPSTYLPTASPYITPAATPRLPEAAEPRLPEPEAAEPGFHFPLPGFDALLALGGLIAVAYLLVRRRRV